MFFGKEQMEKQQNKTEEITIVTKHAEKRLKERLGLTKKSLQRITDRAYTDGISHKETKGNLKKWMDSVYLKEKTANNMKLYGDKIFLFDRNILITILPIPNNLKNDVNRLMKK